MTRIRKLIKSNSHVVQLSIILLGVVAIALATALEDCVFLSVELDKALSNVGAVLLVTAALQWFFDFRMREALISEIAEAAIGSERIARSGIADFIDNSTNVDYSEEIRRSDKLIIGLHYSSRILEHNLQHLRDRSKRKKKTTIVALDPASPAASFLQALAQESRNIDEKARALQKKIDEVFDGHVDSVNVVSHHSILRYSFVLGDSLIWLKFYKNSSKLDTIPALMIRSGTPLFEFFEKDITDLINDAEKHG